jgi:hypothetical protein
VCSRSKVKPTFSRMSSLAETPIICSATSLNAVIQNDEVWSRTLSERMYLDHMSVRETSALSLCQTEGTYRWIGESHFLSHFSHNHPSPLSRTFLLQPSGFAQAG